MSRIGHFAEGSVTGAVRFEGTLAEAINTIHPRLIDTIPTDPLDDDIGEGLALAQVSLLDDVMRWIGRPRSVDPRRIRAFEEIACRRLHDAIKAIENLPKGDRFVIEIHAEDILNAKARMTAHSVPVPPLLAAAVNALVNGYLPVCGEARSGPLFVF